MGALFDPTRHIPMETPFSCGLVWLRRDLRVSDHAALHQALKHCQRVHVAFVFDTEILDALPRADRRSNSSASRWPRSMPACANWRATPKLA